MTTQTAESSNAHDLEHIACAAPFVFLLVAAADGNIDKKELKRFSKLIADDEYAILAAAMTQAGLSMEQLLAACQTRLQDPVNELMALAKVIDSRLPGETALQFKTALLKLGHAIAQASGGFLGFGKKIDKQEAAMLALLVAAFSQSENAEGENAQTDVLNDQLFPALKTAEWASEAKGSVAMQGIYLTEEIKQTEPVVGYVHDNPQTVSFVPADSLGERTLTDVHNHAMENLERRLASVEWQELSFDPGVPELETIDGMVLAGDYFASEAILSETIMKKAHELSNSALLMAIVPQRGELFVSQLISEENPEYERVVFAQFAIKKFFNPEQAPISPNVFIIRNGKIVGNIGGMEQIIEKAKEMAEAEREKEDSLLEHSGRLTGTQDGASLAISVTAHCVDTMLQNLQHVIRHYVQAVIKEDSFDGAVNVAVSLTDGKVNAENQGHVESDLGSMSQFLTDQFASLNFTASKGAPVTVACTLEVVTAT